MPCSGSCRRAHLTRRNRNTATRQVDPHTTLPSCIKQRQTSARSATTRDCPAQPHQPSRQIHTAARNQTTTPGRGPETSHSNPHPTLQALDTFRFSDHLNKNQSLDASVEFVLTHWTIRSPIGPCHHGIGTQFMLPRHPVRPEHPIRCWCQRLSEAFEVPAGAGSWCRLQSIRRRCGLPTTRRRGQYARRMVGVREPRVDETLAWLLGGDAAIQFQTRRDLMRQERPDIQRRIASEGDARTLLAAHADPGWGRGFYQPKWTCPHYSLLELCDLAVARDQPVCVDEVAGAIERHKGGDGGFNPSISLKESDVCVNGMFLAFGCWFGADAAGLESIVDFVLGQRLDDGGFNCRANRSGARVSSVHSTTSVIDGLAEYLRCGYTYRTAEARDAIDSATETLLARYLYQRRSDGEPIRVEFTRLHHPTRWHFDVLRGLDVLRSAGAAYDDRLDRAVEVVLRRRRADGRWSAAAQYPGQAHVAYPRAGQPNRWITLRALRVLAWATS